MGNKLVSRTAKLLSETKRIKGKEAVAIAYEHIPRNPREQEHGSLYAVIEIEDPGGHAEEIAADDIIDTFYQEYYSDLDKDSLASFESALAKINERLTERSGNGHINWLGKLNAVLAVMTDRTIHITQAGKAEAFLYRGEHSMDITQGLTGDAINPLRTFINVASGDLAENDRMAIVTPGIFLKISKNELKKYSTEGSPRIAVDNLSKILSGEAGSVKPNAVLILEMLSPESVAAEPEGILPDEGWVKEDSMALEPIAEQGVHGVAKAFDILGKVAGGASTFITAKVVPAIKSGADTAVDKVKSFRKESGAERIILESEEKLQTKPTKETNFTPDAIDDDLTEDDGIIGGDQDSPVNEIRIKETDQKPKLLSLERFDFSGVDNFRRNLFGRVRGFRFDKKVIMGIAALALVGVAVFAFYSGVFGSDKESQNKLNQAQEKYNTAQAEISSGQKTQAYDDLVVAEKLATEASASKSLKEESTELIAKIKTAMDGALGIKKDAFEKVLDLGSKNFGSAVTDGRYIYGVDYNNGTVSKYDPNTGTKSTLIDSPSAITSKVKLAAFSDNRKSIVVVLENGSVFELNVSTKRVQKQTVSGTLEAADSIAVYNSNLYVLSVENNQIYKHIKTSFGYGRKTAYLKEEANLAGAVSISIDSSVYVSFGDGKFDKYTSGKKDTFTTTGLPSSLAVKGAFAVAGLEDKYLFTNDYLIKVGNTGGYIESYKADQVTSINSVLSLNDTIYVLSNGIIYKVK
jgi:hypothetical protein